MNVRTIQGSQKLFIVGGGYREDLGGGPGWRGHALTMGFSSGLTTSASGKGGEGLFRKHCPCAFRRNTAANVRVGVQRGFAKGGVVIGC